MAPARLRHRRRPGGRQRRADGRAGAGPRPGGGPGAARPAFLVGRDTRRSGPLLQAALSAGLATEGADVVDLGVLPDAGVACSAPSSAACPAPMVSASHNPFADNGIKLFGAGGTKLPDEIEAAIEASSTRHPRPPRRRPRPPTGHGVGRIVRRPRRGRRRTASTWPASSRAAELDGLRVVLDCANGAATAFGPRRLRRASGATVTAIACDARRRQHQRRLRLDPPRASSPPRWWPRGADLGLAFDGDADRLVAVDHTGAVADGDELLALFAVDLADRGELSGNAVVVTVMTNLGFRLAMADGASRCTRPRSATATCSRPSTPRGWLSAASSPGTSCSAELATTGDGILTGLVLADLVRADGAARWPSWPTGLVERVPQVLVNVAVADPGRLVAAAERLGGGGGGGGRAGRQRPGAAAPERHRARGPGDGGGRRRRSRPPRRRAACVRVVGRTGRVARLRPRSAPVALSPCAASSASPARTTSCEILLDGPRPPRVPGLRLGRAWPWSTAGGLWRARAADGHPLGGRAGAVAAAAPSGCRTGHRPHPLGHPRAPDRGQRPPPPRLHRAAGHGPQRDHREPHRAGRRAAGRGPHPRLGHRHRDAGPPDRGGAGAAGRPLVEAVRAALRQVARLVPVAVVARGEPEVIVAARRVTPLVVGLTEGTPRSWPRTSPPSSAGPAASRPGGRPAGRAAPGVGLGDHPRRHGGRAHRAQRRLGPRGRPEGRLRRLHEQGDPRAAPGGGRHAARPARPDGTIGPRRDAHHRRRAGGRRQGLHRGLRQQLPRRHGGQVRHRALDPAADRGRHRQRVPVPRPGARHADPGGRGQPVRRDPRHPPGDARGQALGGQGARRSPTWSTPRWPARPTACSTPGPGPRSAWPPPRPTWPRSWRSRSWPCYLAQLRGHRSPARRSRRLFDRAWASCPDRVDEALGRAKEVDAVAGQLADARDFFFLGRHVGYPVALEGALKLKELSYLRAEGYPAGELKHGPIALIEPGTVVVAVATATGCARRCWRNMAEVQSRGATVVAGGRRRRRGDGGGGRPRAVGARGRAAALPGGRRGAPAAASPTAWLACAATTWTARATWPRP